MDPNAPSDFSFTSNTPVVEPPPAIPSQEPTPAAQPPSEPHKFPLANILLISGICLFILSIGFFVYTQKNIVTSEASQQPEENILPSIMPTTSPMENNFAKTYKDETIPQELYISAESQVTQEQINKDIYIQSMIMKFFIYRDVLTENDPSYQVDTPDNFARVETVVTEMEQKLSETVLGKADFGYITAHIANTIDPASKQAAKTLLESYRESLTSETYSIQQMVDVAAQDETLVTMGKGKVSGILTDYDSTRSLFPQTAEFDEFLFHQKVNQVSPVYTLKDLQSQDYALVIVYPTRLESNKYTSLFKILEEYKNHFSY